MRGMSKADTLDLLESMGLNTVDRIVLKKPLRAENLIGSLMNFPHEKISLRSWKEGSNLCPFYPDRTVDQLLQIVNDDWDKITAMDEIILAQGINPDRSQMAGKIMDIESEFLVEYFNGPGTVRKLDTIIPLCKRFPKSITIHKTRQSGLSSAMKEMMPWVPLYLAAKYVFRSYPGSLIEWSMYPDKIGKKQENFIYWEIL